MSPSPTHRRWVPALTVLVLLAGGIALASAVDATATDRPGTATDAWDRALRRHVADGGVRYAALAADRSGLDRFLGFVAATAPQTIADRGDRLAYLVNAYNALVIDGVLARYPGIGSVREVDGFFDRADRRLGGSAVSLDAVEERARALDPRVHFALVCASTSCPDLRPEAYRGARIEGQLADQTRRFLADRDKGLRYERGANRLHLSSIFKWYAGDFTGGSTLLAFFARGGVRDWIAEHLADAELAARLREQRPEVVYMDYDWSLNDRR